MPNADAPDPPPPPPELPLREVTGHRVHPSCPTCGQADAGVFPYLNNGHPPDTAPLVCLRCCPTRGTS